MAQVFETSDKKIRPMNKLVSIVIPAYNARNYISHAVASCLSQTYAQIEILVIDDGSTDDTVEVARGFQDDRVSVHRIPNGGAGRARNAGLRLATGDYIMFLDADDAISEVKVERQMRLISGKLDVVALCNWKKVPGEICGPQELTQTASPSMFLIRTMLTGEHTQTACWLYPKGLLSGCLWSEYRDHPDDDAEFHAQVLAKATRILGDIEPLVYYRDHAGDRLSKASGRLAIDNRFRTIKAHEKAIERMSAKVPEKLARRAIATAYLSLAYQVPVEHDELFQRALQHSREYRIRPKVIVGSRLMRICGNINPFFPFRVRRILKKLWL